MQNLFLLRPGIAFLNHGSYGACPRPVFEVYQSWQRELEAQPVEFLSRRAPGLLNVARASLGHYLNTSPANLAFVTNATTGINVVARSLKLGPGDEILATDHEYGAIDRTWRFVCAKTGATYRNYPLGVPFAGAAEFVEILWSAVTPRTRVISLSHITSSTALIFPIREICRRAAASGILTVIDGAHAPGQLDTLDLTDLGADFYAGNCHKWLCAPKGSGFLYASPAVQSLVEPLVVSWGFESLEPGLSQFIDWVEWQGTRDLASWLAVPAAIEFQANHGWEAVRRECQTLLLEACQRVNELTGLPSIYPAEPGWMGQMATIRLPPCDLLTLKSRLWDEYRVEVPVISWNNEFFLRVSIQGYNTRQDIDALLAGLTALLPQVAG